MARSKNRSAAHTCPRCAALLTLGASHCGLCQLDLTAPIAPVVELVPAAVPVEWVIQPVVEPADEEYTSTSVFLPLPHDLPAVSAAIANEPTPLAPVELLSEARSVDFALFNPRDPFSWYPVVQA